jgi:D-alanyl-D-alanine carboxypeptidase-like protein
MRTWLVVVVLLMLGFAGGFLASRAGDEDRADQPVTAVRAAPSAPAPAPAPPTTAPAPPTTEQPRPKAMFAAAPLSSADRHRLRDGGFWRSACPVPLSGLRLLTVTYRGFDRMTHTGQIVVNATAAGKLERVFRRLYRQRFPIRHIGFSDFYGPRSEHPSDGDVTASFECRQAVPSPCTGGMKSGHWSMHAYGLAVDLNPTENPYIGCGQSRDPATRPYRDRSRHRRGMVDARALKAFGSVGWGWGGAWTGSTKDYMHFSATGH